MNFQLFCWDVEVRKGLSFDLRCHMCMHVRLEMFVIVIYLPVSFKVVPTSKGQALADEYGIKFFETVSGVYQKMWKPLNFLLLCSWKIPLQSAKTNLNVEEVFFSIARDIKQRLADTDSKAEVFELPLSVLKCLNSSLFLSEVDIFIAAINNQNQPRPIRWSRGSCTKICLLWLMTNVTNWRQHYSPRTWRKNYMYNDHDADLHSTLSFFIKLCVISSVWTFYNK